MGEKLTAAIREANRKYGSVEIGTLASKMAVDVPVFSSGNMFIDFITRIGGLPRGRIIELYGPPASGKTTTGLQTAATALAMDEAVAYFDYENALDPTYCASLGLDVDSSNFLISQPDTLEDGMNAAQLLITSGELGVLVIDSVASMVPAAELNGELGDARVAIKPRLMSEGLRKMVGPVRRNGTCVIFVNHIQQVLDPTPMGKRLASAGVQRNTTPGGTALKFYSSMRIEYKPIGGVRSSQLNELTNEDQDVVSAQKVQVTVTKNKVGAPFGQCEVRVEFGKGFSQNLSVLNFLTTYGIIPLKSGVYRFDSDTQPPDMNVEESPKDNWIRGEANVLERMEANPEWAAKLDAMAQVKLKELIKPRELTVDEQAISAPTSEAEITADQAAEAAEATDSDAEPLPKPDVNVDALLSS